MMDRSMRADWAAIRAGARRRSHCGRCQRRTRLGRTLRRALASYACFYAAVALGWYVDPVAALPGLAGCYWMALAAIRAWEEGAHE